MATTKITAEFQECCIDKAALELKEHGVTLIPDVFSRKKCQELVAILDDLISNQPDDTKNRINEDVQSINNYFRHDTKLLDLIHVPVLDALFNKIIGKDHVLISANTFNRSKRVGINQNVSYENSKNAGHDWHIDSDYIGGVRLEAGFSYQVIIMLEDFTPENGATHYVRNSHELRTKPDRDGEYKYELFTGSAGWIGIIDTGLWHRSGGVTPISRWGAFNMYGPWFVKPYFRFPEMLGDHIGKTLSPQLRRLLHYRSTPPIDEQERLNTVISEPEN